MQFQDSQDSSHEELDYSDGGLRDVYKTIIGDF